MATKHWVGGAPAKYDVWTITLALTWAANDTLEIKIGQKSLLVTVGSSDKAAIIAEAIVAFNALRFDEPLPPTGFSRNVGGQQIPEFTEATAAAHPTDTLSMVITAVEAGVPLGVSVVAGTAGDGTATATNSTVATGPNFLDNAQNYLNGALPVDNDLLYFDIGDVSCLYGLSYFRTNSIDLAVIITSDWIGQLGLPETNAARGYAEYRTRYFAFRGGSKVLRFDRGLLGRSNLGRCWINLEAQASVEIIIKEGRGGSINNPAIFLAGSDASTGFTDVTIESGSVALDPVDAAVSSIMKFANLTIGRLSNAANDPAVIIHSTVALADATAVYQHSGVTLCYAASESGGSGAIINLYGGEFTMYGLTHFDVNVHRGATFFPASESGGGTVNVYGGAVDCRRASSGSPMSPLRVFPGSTIIDPVGSSAQEINLLGGSHAESVLVLPPNRLLDITAAAT